MNIKDAVDYVSRKFKYKSDPKGIIDKWFVMKEKNLVMEGDCDDFTMTSLWYANDQKILKFIWNVMITHRHGIHRVKTITNGYHIVGTVGDVWFDNWTKKTMLKDDFFKATKHKHLYKLWSPLFIMTIINGYRYR